MTDSLAARAHQNLADFAGFQHRLEEGSHLLDGDVVAFAGITDFPSSRSALRVGDLGAEDAADRIEAFLFEYGKTALVFARVGPDDDLTAVLAERGYREFDQSPEMVCDVRLPARDVPDGVTLRLATSTDDVFGYASVAAHAFRHIGLPEDDVRRALERPDVILGSDVAVSIAEIDGRVVGGALVVLLGAQNTGYVGWVSVHDSARGRGLGDLVTRQVTNAAFDLGTDLVTLEASRFGRNTYDRMGYRTLYNYRMMIKF
jgi:GNAT superfamily N-acetyltransferase